MYLLATTLDHCGGQGRNGLASLALRAHYVRLSPLRGSVEPPTRRFSERQVIGSALKECRQQIAPPKNIL